MTRTMPILAILALLWAPALAEAQRELRRERPQREMTPQQMRESVQRTFEERMARSLDLSRDQREGLGEVLASFREARSELASERRELRREARLFLARNDGDEDRARELLDGLRELRETEERIRREEEERLLGILTPSQLLRMQLIREEFGVRIRRLEARPGRMRSRPGGGAAGS